MTTPITFSIPKNLSEFSMKVPEANSKLQVAADKTAKIFNPEVERPDCIPVTTAISPPTNPLPFSPNVGHAVANVAASSLINILNMPRELMRHIAGKLNNRDLCSLDIAISKFKEEEIYPQVEALRGIVKEVIQQNIWNDILADCPAWKSQVNTWITLSLQDRNWLLRVCIICPYEAHLITHESTDFTYPRMLQLLQPKQKEVIAHSLACLETFCINEKSTSHAICLMPNLQRIKSKISLTKPPNLTFNVNLQVLDLSWNKIKVCPQLRNNINLEVLNLSWNPITSAPDLTQNGKLKELRMAGCQLTIPPELRQNPLLETLEISYNKLTTLPDLNANTNLKVFDIALNPLDEEAKKALEVMKQEHPERQIKYYSKSS